MGQPFLTVDNITRRFDFGEGGTYVALSNINLEVGKGEFIALIGHSGCGKSTLLNLIAGLDQASDGGILINGRQVTDPGPDRMVVFQNYSLLPWKTVRQNIQLAVDNALRHQPPDQRRVRVQQAMDSVALGDASEKFPAELSGGMKQRVAIARALAIEPQLLLLDEPFGALDALTRGNLQEQLMQISQQAGITAVMVTHDVDEALLLADRVICLSNGPQACIAQILSVDLPRPRSRLSVMDHPNYYGLRSELIGFLQQQRRLRQHSIALQRQAPVPSDPAGAGPTAARPGTVQGAGSRLVRIGYMPGLDVAPLAMALDRRLLAAEAIQVAPLPFATWERLEDALRGGQVDVAITPATTPLRLNLGLDGGSPWPAIAAMTVSRNGSALCISRLLGDQGVTDRDGLDQWLSRRDRPFRVAVPQRQGMAELLLRHWLAAGGIDVERDVAFQSLAPLTMQASLRNERIDGFCAGRYRVADAVQERQGLLLATDREIWQGHPEKVLTCREDWAAAHGELLLALCAALMRAGERCDDGGQRQAIVELLSQPQWLGRQAAAALGRQFDSGADGCEGLIPYNRFHADRAHQCDPAEGCWLLSQFSRWGWIPFPANRLEILARVYRQDLCDQALTLAGFPVLPLPRRPLSLSDGLRFDPDDPIAYLGRLPGAPSPPVRPLPLPSSPQASAGPSPSLPTPR